MTRASISLALALALCGCGDDATPSGGSSDYALPNPAPVPQALSAGDRVRVLIVRREDRAGAARRDVTCGLTTLLFDVTQSAPNPPAAIDNANNCRFYGSDPTRTFPQQRQVCAGAINVSSGALMQTIGFCPTGSNPALDVTFPTCGDLGSTRMGALSSMDELGADDAVTDLMARVELPTAPAITGPSELPTTTWPESGDLDITWTSLDATSAMVRLTPAEGGDPASLPVVICTPSRNGRVRVSQEIIAQSMFRARDVRVEVWSYRDLDATAENGARYRVVGAMATNLVLQGRR